MVDSSLSLWLSDPEGSGETQLPSLGDGLREAARRWPEIEAFVYTDPKKYDHFRLTYRALDEQTESLALAVLSSGIAPGERVAIWGPNHKNWILLEYALAKAGIVIVTLNPLYKRAELVGALRASSVVAVFHADEVGGQQLEPILRGVGAEVPTLRATYSFSSGIARLRALPIQHVRLPVIDPNSVLMVQYTSGTTGVPKAAQLSHAGIGNISRSSYRRWGFGPGDRVCHGFPLFHVGGAGNSTPGAMFVGATTLPMYVFKADQALEILEREGCTGFIGVPTMLAAMLAEPSRPVRNLSSLKYIVIGGAPVPAALLRRCESAFGAKICNSYGQTETSGVITSTVADDPDILKLETSGTPLPGINLKIVDPAGSLVKRGVAGELLYDGPGNMLGYIDERDDSAVHDCEGWIRTGDLATMNQNGYIKIVGRSKDMIIRGGENLYPAEIEKYLLEHPNILEVAVIGLPDAKYGEEVCAVLRIEEVSNVTEEMILGWCRENISRWKVPRYIAMVQEFPVTASGKIHKPTLRSRMMVQFGLYEKS